MANALFWILTKENNPKASPVNQRSNQETQSAYPEKIKIEEASMVCGQLLQEVLEEDENAFVFEENTKAEPVECMFVSCGGFI